MKDFFYKKRKKCWACAHNEKGECHTQQGNCCMGFEMSEDAARVGLMDFFGAVVALEERVTALQAELDECKEMSQRAIRMGTSSDDPYRCKW